MDILNKIMTEQHIPGLAVIVQRGDEILFEGYHGLANIEHQIAVHENTVFEIASVTKLFTSQAILRLAQDGKLQIDDRLVEYLPMLPEAWHTVTIRNVLAHQSGLPSYTSEKRYWEITQHTKSHDQIIDLVREKPLIFPPMTRNAYDNTGYYLLGMVIEAVSGKTYGDYLRDVIFQPLELAHIQVNDYARIIPHRAQGYIYQDGVLRNKPYYDISNTFSAGILLSNARDLLLWSASLYNDSILNSESRGLWWTQHPSQAGNEREFNYTVGLGWFFVDEEPGTMYAHNGGIAGFVSSFLHLPETKTTAVVLCNGGHVADPHKIAFEIMRH